MSGILGVSGIKCFLRLALRSEASRFSQKVQNDFAAYNQAHQLPYQLNVSIGFVSHSPRQPLSALIERADHELYNAKRERLGNPA